MPYIKKLAAAMAVLIVLCALATPAFAEDIGRLATEREIYRFLTEDMDLNTAAASGVLANIEYESAFRLDCWGDAGTSFGICQWHEGRFDSLRIFCASRGLDHRTLAGQLAYLEYELRGTYSGLYGKLLHVENSPLGAYQAGYWWCVMYERPVDPEQKGVIRGNLAQFKYFRRYDSMTEIDGYVWQPSDPGSFSGNITGELIQVEESIPGEPEPVATDPSEETVPEPAGTKRHSRPVIRRYTPYHTPAVTAEMPAPPVIHGYSGWALCFLMLGDGKIRFCRIPEPEAEPEGVSEGE